MIRRIYTIFAASVIILSFCITGCDDTPPSPPKKAPASNTVSKSISEPVKKKASPPAAVAAPAEKEKPAAQMPAASASPQKAPEPVTSKSASDGEKQAPETSGEKSSAQAVSVADGAGTASPDQQAAIIAELKKPKDEHYNAQGKIDPFKPLFQEKSDVRTPALERPERILTPLEKIELSQIRLVAVLATKNRKFAMVEEASGKGYEVQIGTYMGKNQGRIVEIRDSSILVKEIYRDFKGRLKERVKEIKMHKKEGEE